MAKAPPQSGHWFALRRFGRATFQVHVYRHRCHNAPDRWVIQPSLIWDRRANG